MRIKNLTGSPYQLTDKTGAKVMLPAFGEVVIDPHHMHEPYYRQVGYFEVSDSRGGARIDSLRNEYIELLGKAPDNRWGESRLRGEIDNARSST